MTRRKLERGHRRVASACLHLGTLTLTISERRLGEIRRYFNNAGTLLADKIMEEMKGNWFGSVMNQ